MNAVRSGISKFLIIAAILQLIWGLVPSASKAIIDEIPIELYIALRWTISGGLFAILHFVFRGRKSVSQPISLRHSLSVAMLGILGYGAASFGALYGLQIGGVANFALLGSLSPVVTSVLSISLLQERPHKYFPLALLLSVLGLALIVFGKYQVSTLSIAWISACLIFGSYILEGMVFVFSKRFKNHMSTLQYLAISQCAAALVMWLLQGLIFHQSSQVVQLSLRGLGLTLFVAIVACVLCYGVLYWLLHHVAGHKLALFEGLHTISAAFFGWLFFQDALNTLMALGGGLILLGLALGSWQSSRATAATGTVN